MAFFLVLALMTAAAVFAVLWPLSRRTSRLRSGSDLAVYRDQLDEIERDRASGLIEDSEATAARVEVSRRLIAAADDQETPETPATSPAETWRRRPVAVAVLVLVPIGAGAIYLVLGSPGMIDQPRAERLATVHAGRSIDDLVAQVEMHLQSHPDDGRGWEVIAPVYLRLGRADDAVAARRNALRLNGQTAERDAALGEALVAAANGVVTAEAKQAFEKALALDAKHVEARYFIGVAAEQDGDRTRAADIWRGLIADAPKDAAWTSFVRAALERVEGGVQTPAPSPPADAGPPGPSQEQIAAASNLNADQRNTMVRGMMERLAERLHRDGSDVDGWMRLIRSHVVLGEPDKARAAVSDARRALAGDATKLKRLDDFAKEMGLEG
jgi:cytochrome c-type biogenesis protein CcmH